MEFNENLECLDNILSESMEALLEVDNMADSAEKTNYVNNLLVIQTNAVHMLGSHYKKALIVIAEQKNQLQELEARRFANRFKAALARLRAGLSPVINNLLNNN